MKAKAKTLILSILTAGSLLLAAVPASAHDNDYRYRRERDSRYDNRGYGDRSGLYHELQAARERLNYDASHHKSRKQLAKDEANIRNIESQIGGGWSWGRGW
jgi:hypothetical protein